jgi:hypothetical protein
MDSYTYADEDPVNADDPTGQSVNLAGTAAWAVQNLHKAIEYYSPDCTDFVSQALYYGGDDPQNIGPNAMQDSRNNLYWFFYNSSRERIASLSWSVAPDLASHLRLNGSKWLVQSGTTPNKSSGRWSQVHPGDIIFANWQGSNFGGITHCGIIVSVEAGTPYLEIAQHSFDRIDTLTFWLKSGSNTHVWIVDPSPR